MSDHYFEAVDRFVSGEIDAGPPERIWKIGTCRRCGLVQNPRPIMGMGRQSPIKMPCPGRFQSFSCNGYVDVKRR